jgi:ABC-type multidrug transport system fused ATPase/permease subunit
VDLCSEAFRTDNASLAQDREMLTDLGLALSGRFDEFLNGPWSLTEQVEDLQPGGLCKHLAEFRLQSIELSFLFWVHLLHQAPSYFIQTFDLVNILIPKRAFVKRTFIGIPITRFSGLFRERQRCQEKWERLGHERIDILKGITLRIQKGEFGDLFGPSGSGKSTQQGIIAGLKRVL